MKIKGIYIDKDELFTKMIKAYDNPAIYIQATDPEYVFNRINELEEQISLLRIENQRMKDSVSSLLNRGFFGNLMVIPEKTIKQVIKIKKDNPKITKKAIIDKLKEDNITISEWEITVIVGLNFYQLEE